jgi:hypothetical protein
VSILLTAPIGLICISKLGPRWLHQDVVDGDELEPSYHAVAIAKDKTSGINESWAINERNRRDDDSTIAVRKRTQAIRFFSKMKEQMTEIDKLLAKDDSKKAPIDPNSSEDVLLSEIESPTKSPLNASTSINVDDDAPKTGLSDSVRKQIEGHMTILEDGIDSVWRVIEDNIEFIPTNDLFLNTTSGGYKDVPTYQEMTDRLSVMLRNDDDNDQDELESSGLTATGERKTGRLGSFHLGGTPALPQRNITASHSSRSFSGYKATTQDIELFKKEHKVPHEL